MATIARGHYIKSTKTGRERTVPLTRNAADASRRLRVQQAAEILKNRPLDREDGFVFADELERPLKVDVPTRMFARIAGKVQLAGVTLHSLRHSVATWALTSGTDVKTVSALLGHSAASTTLNIYGHTVVGLQAKDVQRIGEALASAEARLVAAAKRPQ